MGEQAEDGAPQGGPHLDDKLHLVIGGVTGRDEGGVQRPTEGGQRVHGLLVVEAEDGVHPPGELGADWKHSGRGGGGGGERGRREGRAHVSF